jgi:hypothetical protein
MKTGDAQFGGFDAELRNDAQTTMCPGISSYGSKPAPKLLSIAAGFEQSISHSGLRRNGSFNY